MKNILCSVCPMVSNPVCGTKVVWSNPGCSKVSGQKYQWQALCLGGHTKVRVPFTTIARQIPSVGAISKVITPQYYASNGALLSHSLIIRTRTRNQYHRILVSLIIFKDYLQERPTLPSARPEVRVYILLTFIAQLIQHNIMTSHLGGFISSCRCQTNGVINMSL